MSNSIAATDQILIGRRTVFGAIAGAVATSTQMLSISKALGGSAGNLAEQLADYVAEMGPGPPTSARSRCSDIAESASLMSELSWSRSRGGMINRARRDQHFALARAQALLAALPRRSRPTR